MSAQAPALREQAAAAEQHRDTVVDRERTIASLEAEVATLRAQLAAPLPEALAEIESLAKAATPGPWETDGGNVVRSESVADDFGDMGVDVCEVLHYGRPGSDGARTGTPEYIAKLDPDTALRLLSALRGALAEAAEQRAFLACDGDCGACLKCARRERADADARAVRADCRAEKRGDERDELAKAIVEEVDLRHKNEALILSMVAERDDANARADDYERRLDAATVAHAADVARARQAAAEAQQARAEAELRADAAEAAQAEVTRLREESDRLDNVARDEATEQAREHLVVATSWAIERENLAAEVVRLRTLAEAERALRAAQQAVRAAEIDVEDADRGGLDVEEAEAALAEAEAVRDAAAEALRAAKGEPGGSSVDHYAEHMRASAPVGVTTTPPGSKP